MKLLEKKAVLNNGTEIPVIGLGTWQVPAEIAERVVREGIETGYRHIDTAYAYGNEREVGLGIKASGIDRSEIYVTTKIKAEFKSYEEAKKQIDESLANLDCGYIDLILIHCPTPWKEFGNRTKTYYLENLAVWKAMEEAVDAGKVRSIGVSNFSPDDLNNILKNCRIRPVCNQICLHIGLTQEETVTFCRENGIAVEAYSPIATGGLLKHPDVVKMAKKYRKTPAQLSIRYSLEKAEVTLPKTTHQEFMAENADVDFEIREKDMKVLDAIRYSRY